MSNFKCCGSKRHVRTIERRSAKSVLATLHSAIVSIKLSNGGQEQCGILLSSSIVLTTNGCVPSRAAADNGDITLYPTASKQRRTGGPAMTVTKKKLLPERCFLTNRAMDVTIMACEDAAADGITTLNLDLNHAGCDTAGDLLDMGDLVYLLGNVEKQSDSFGVTMGERIVCDEEFETSLEFLSDIKQGYDVWTAGSAGFDTKGNFKFLVNRPIEVDGNEERGGMEKTRQSGTKIRAITEWLLAHGVRDVNDLVAGLSQASIAMHASSLTQVEKPNRSLKHGLIDSSPSKLALMRLQQDLPTPPPGSAESSTKTVPRCAEDMCFIEPFSSSLDEGGAGHSTVEDGAPSGVYLQSEPGNRTSESAISFCVSSTLKAEEVKAEELQGGESVAENTVQLKKMQVVTSATKERLREGRQEMSLTLPSTPPVSSGEEQARPESAAAMIVDITNTMRDSGNHSHNNVLGEIQGQSIAKSILSPGIQKIRVPATEKAHPAATTKELRSTSAYASTTPDVSTDSVQGKKQGRTAVDLPVSQPLVSTEEAAGTPPSPSISTDKATENLLNLELAQVTLSPSSSDEGSTIWFSATNTPQISPMKPGPILSGEGGAGAVTHPQSPTTPLSALRLLELKMQVQGFGNMSRLSDSKTPPCSAGLIGSPTAENIPASRKKIHSHAILSPGHSLVLRASLSPKTFSPRQYPAPRSLLSQTQPVSEIEQKPCVLGGTRDHGGQFLVVSPGDASESGSTITARNKTKGFKNVNLAMLSAQVRGSRDLPLPAKTNRVPELRKDIDDAVGDIGTNAMSGTAS